MELSTEKIDWKIRTDKPLTPAKKAMKERHDTILQVFAKIREMNADKSETACIVHTALQLNVATATVRNVVKGKTYTA